MASALQKLFKKKLNKQQSHNRDQRKDAGISASRPSSTLTGAGHRSGPEQRQSYFTVSSLNSPAPTPTQSRLPSTTSPGYFGTASTSTIDLTRSSSYSKYNDGRSRSNSFSAEAMLRRDSCSGRPWEASTPVDQFGNLSSPIMGPGSSCSGQLPFNAAPSETEYSASRPPSDDEDDVSKNPLFSALFAEQNLADTLRHAKIVLLPDVESLQRIKGAELLRNASYLGLHALVPSGLFKGEYTSSAHIAGSSAEQMNGRLSVTAVLRPEDRVIDVAVTRAGGTQSDLVRIERKLHVQEETTAFHSFLRPDRSRKDRVRFRVLAVHGLVVPASFFTGEPVGMESSDTSRAADSSNDASNSSCPTVDMSRTPSRETPPSALHLDDDIDSERQDPIPLHRDFLIDFALMIDPDPRLERLKPAINTALATIRRAADDFVNAYIYVPGFDTYNVSRIRRGILARGWQAFEDARVADQASTDEASTRIWGSNGRQRLLLLMENVVMGLCQIKVYSSIRSVMWEPDQRFDTLLATYKDANATPKDFDASLALSNGTRLYLDKAEKMLSFLGRPSEDIDAIIQHQDVTQMRTIAATSSWRQHTRTGPDATGPFSSSSIHFRPVQTPLEVLELMTAILETLAGSFDPKGSTSTQSERQAMSADTLLPLLAYTLVRSCPVGLVSMMYYVRLFGLSDATSAKQAWALTTFETAAEYLKTDPLRLCDLLSQQPTERALGAAVAPREATSDASGSILAHEASKQKDASQSRHLTKRIRHISLPSKAMLAEGSNTADHGIDHARRGKPKRHVTNAARGDASPFKVPGQPASASASSVARTSTEALRSGSVSPEKGLRNSLSSRDPSLSHHNRSSSLSKEVTIRPQIVMRTRASRVPSVLQRSCTMERVQSEPEASASSGSSVHRSLQGDVSPVHSREPTGPRLDTRRTSLDSWSAMSLFGALNLGSVTTEPPAYDPSSEQAMDTTATQKTEAVVKRTQSPSESIFSGMSAPSSLSPSTSSWFTLWQGDPKERAVRSAAPEPPAKMNSVGQRPSPASSMLSSGSGPLSPMAIPRSNSVLSTTALYAADVSSMPSLDAHDASTEGHGSECASSPREQRTRCEAVTTFPQIGSSGESLEFIEVSSSSPLRDIRNTKMEKAQRRHSRSRLLSITNLAPASPSPWTANAAMALATPTNVERMWSDVDKGTPVASNPRQSWLYKVANSSRAGAVDATDSETSVSDACGDVTTETILDHGPRSAVLSTIEPEYTAPATRSRANKLFRPTMTPLTPEFNASSSTRTRNLPSLRLHIPTPVEEIADPMSLQTS